MSFLNDIGIPDLKQGITFKSITNGALGLVQGAFWNSLKGSRENWGLYTKPTKTGKIRRLGEKDTPQTTKEALYSLASLNNYQISVLNIGVGGNSTASDFPVEEGSFATYNKVVRPETVRVSYAVSGSETDRVLFLNEIRDAKNGNTLLNVYMPETIGLFQNYTIVNYQMNRSAESGAAIFYIDVDLVEVKEIQAQYIASNKKTAIKEPKKVQAKPKTNTGKVQAAVANKPLETKSREVDIVQDIMSIGGV